jgi:thiamine pyrophosphate-dependent acetolactate synthase large subunit-like protein
MKGTSFGTSLFQVPLDVTGMARALGATAVKVSSPAELRAALVEALQAPGPTVLDAVVDTSELPPTLMRRAQTLAEFSAMRRRTDPPTSTSVRPLVSSSRPPQG